MRKCVLGLAVFALVAVPTATTAQVGVAGRVGTLGIGGEAGLELSENLVLRGGMGFMPVTLSQEINDVDTDATFPSTITAGVDLFPGGGSFRISGGVLFRPDDIKLEGTPNRSIEFGGTTYSATDLGRLTGTIGSDASIAPYVTIGWGRITSPGFGLFIDIGGAYLGDPVVDLTSSNEAEIPGLQLDIDEEIEQTINDDIGKYLQFYPILSVGVRIGVN